MTHEYLQQSLGFPDYYGRNFSALADCLSEAGEPLLITVNIDPDTLPTDMQAFVMKLANNHTPDAESVFVYMAISAVLLIPVALVMTDWSVPISKEFNGPVLMFFVQILNAIGALTLVYANRYGKAMIVAPLADACAPVITCILSLVLYQAFPTLAQIIGIIAAISCVIILGRE